MLVQKKGAAVRANTEDKGFQSGGSGRTTLPYSSQETHLRGAGS